MNRPSSYGSSSAGSYFDRDPRSSSRDSYSSDRLVFLQPFFFLSHFQCIGFDAFVFGSVVNVLEAQAVVAAIRPRIVE